MLGSGFMGIFLIRTLTYRKPMQKRDDKKA